MAFSNFVFDDWPSHYGRQIILNDFQIRESGNYALKVEIYDEEGNLLGDCENNIEVEVRDNAVEFISGPYGIEDFIEFRIGAPLSDGQYYNIYLNGELAGNFTAYYGVAVSDDFVDKLFEVELLKPGHYDVNVTFVDGENENDFQTGQIDINSLNLISDKTSYVYNVDDVFISFELDESLEGYRLDAYYLKGWDRVEANEEMIFNPYDLDSMIKDGLYSDGVVRIGIPSDDLELGINYFHVTYRPWDKEDEGISYGGIIAVRVTEAEDVPSNIDISGVNSDVVITLTSEGSPIADADIVYSLNGGSEVDATTDGNGQVTVGAPEGDVLVSVKYGDKEESKTLYFRVSTGMAISSAQNDVVITLTDAFGNRVSGVGITYRLNNGDKIDAATDANGQVIITPLEGTVKVIGSFAGTVAFKASSAVETLNLPVIPKETTLTIAQGNASAVVTLVCGESPVAGANVTYAVNDVESTGVTDENGTFKITNLTGEVALKVTYLGSDAYKASNATVAFNFTAADDNSTGGNGTGNNTNPGGNTEPGNNTNPDQNTTVVKTATVLTAPGFSMVYLNGDSLVITLKDTDGKAISGAVVSVDFGGAVYNVTTDADGKALRSIGLAPNTYTATVTYAGNDTYAASSVTSKITVTKGTPALTAKAKTFKAKTATKKYTVTLKYKGKAANKVKLTLKIGSKTFKATTDANGKATFKITKVTAKKTYTCTVKSKANNLYKAVSKQLKLKSVK